MGMSLRARPASPIPQPKNGHVRACTPLQSMPILRRGAWTYQHYGPALEPRNGHVTPRTPGKSNPPAKE